MFSLSDTTCSWCTWSDAGYWLVQDTVHDTGAVTKEDTSAVISVHKLGQLDLFTKSRAIFEPIKKKKLIMLLSSHC